MTLNPTTDLPAGYRPIDGTYDDFVDGDGVRPHWARVARSLGELGSLELGRRADETRRLLLDDGVTYNATTPQGTMARPWVLDPVPVVISPDEWARLEAGLAQRAELFDMVLADLYGPRRLIADGLVPPEVVYGHPGFLRQCDQIRLRGDRQLFHAAFDLARDRDGSWVVLSDRTQAPSGMGYALENRLVLARVLPELYRDAEVVRLAAFFRALRTALQRVAPEAAEVPRIVVLTPGPWSETAYEHGALASYLGYPLVQGTDLRVRDGRVWERTLGRLEPVHVILRRVDASWCDPLELRPESTLGAPGLVEACRAGNVAVVNTLGSGVLENPGLLAFLPSLAEALLGQELHLPSATTWWCGEPRSRRHVVASLDTLVLKSVGGAVAQTIVGAELSAGQLDELRRRIDAEPHAWVGQDPVELGATPTLIDGALEARRSVLRGYVVSTEDGYAVMPGGLTRVAASRDEVLITNQSGAWSKDTWVLSGEPERLTGFWLQLDAPVAVPETAMSQRAAENLFWLSRYAERAEDLVRQIRVVADRLVEFAPGTNPAGNACLAVLLAALSRTSGTLPGLVEVSGDAARTEPVAELRQLLIDQDRQGTVAHSVHLMLNAAAQVRDQLSNDTWLVIGHLERDLAALDHSAPLSADTRALGRVMAAMLALSGLSAESMVRDDGWQFMEAGRRLERALQLCALLSATVTSVRDAATDSLIIESVLTSAESVVTYRRRYRSHATLATMLDLMVLDPANPRSLRYQIGALAEAVAAMPQPEAAAQVEIDILVEELGTAVALADTDELARAADAEGRERAAVEVLPVSAFLAHVADLLTQLGERIDAAHFSHQLPQRAVAPSSPFASSGHPVQRR
jgi:uncharacterized circularly permuted ATP-grasp superfamily protein/uncharacterized alpha-E superfamily protein